MCRDTAVLWQYVSEQMRMGSRGIILRFIAVLCRNLYFIMFPKIAILSRVRVRRYYNILQLFEFIE